MKDGDGNDCSVEGSVGLPGILDGAVDGSVDTAEALRFAEKNLSNRSNPLAMAVLCSAGELAEAV
jgi:hypothetical protein